MTGWQEEAEKNEALLWALKVEKEILLELEKANRIPGVLRRNPTQ